MPAVPGQTRHFILVRPSATDVANYRWEYYGKTYLGRGVKGQYRKQTTEVGVFPPNAWGFHDMHGNVWEWCEDDWHNSYNGAPTDGSAWIENDNRSQSSEKVLRGGSWYFSPQYCRSACRNLYFQTSVSTHRFPPCLFCARTLLALYSLELLHFSLFFSFLSSLARSASKIFCYIL
jgi:formylglycine-generating enzyme required for sulfatase activity